MSGYTTHPDDDNHPEQRTPLETAVDRCAHAFTRWDILSTAFATLTCEESEGLAHIFTARGHHALAQAILESHAYADESPLTVHHQRWLGQQQAH